QGSFPGADTNTEQHEVPVGLGQAAGGGHQTPEEDTPGDQPTTAARVGHPAQRNPGYGIENSERQAHQQAHLGVGNAQIGTDRADQQIQDLPVDEGQHISQQQNDHGKPGTPRGGVIIVVQH